MIEDDDVSEDEDEDQDDDVCYHNLILSLLLGFSFVCSGV